MTLTPNNVDSNQVSAGAAALDAYESHGRFDDQAPRHRHDRRQAQFLFGELMHDLMHYAAQAGIDVEEELSWVRHSIAGANGEPVHLLGAAVEDSTRRGWVTALHFHAPEQHQYEVQFLGEPAPRRVNGSELGSADFGGVRIGPEVLPTPERALNLLVAAQARIQLAQARGAEPFPRDLRDSRDVLDALAPWGRVTEQELLASLTGRIDATAGDFARHHGQSPMQAAGLDFPQPGIPDHWPAPAPGAAPPAVPVPRPNSLPTGQRGPRRLP